MPELPEVETVVRQLAPLLCGRKVCRLEVFDPQLNVSRPRAVAGHIVWEVRRIAKQVVLRLSAERDQDREIWLSFHLGMTGRLSWQKPAERTDKRHLRARLVLAGGSVLFFDPRRFGRLRLCRSLQELPPLGLDPLSAEFTPPALPALLRGSRQAIKPWLLRQDRLAGVGNIYAAEILFAAGIHPERPANSLGQEEIWRLHRAVRRVLRRAVKLRRPFRRGFFLPC